MNVDGTTVKHTPKKKTTRKKRHRRKRTTTTSTTATTALTAARTNSHVSPPWNEEIPDDVPDLIPDINQTAVTAVAVNKNAPFISSWMHRDSYRKSHTIDGGHAKEMSHVYDGSTMRADVVHSVPIDDSAKMPRTKEELNPRSIPTTIPPPSLLPTTQKGRREQVLHNLSCVGRESTDLHGQVAPKEYGIGGDAACSDTTSSSSSSSSSCDDTMDIMIGGHTHFHHATSATSSASRTTKNATHVPESLTIGSPTRNSAVHIPAVSAAIET